MHCNGMTMSKTKPCIDHGFTTGLSPFGYKQISRGGHLSLHREVFAHSHGLLPADIAGKVVRHSCDNPRCIEPEHLVLGTQADNMRDRSERGRCATSTSKRLLTDADAATIRATFDPTRRGSAAALARQFGVDHGVIRQIVLGSSYRSK